MPEMTIGKAAARAGVGVETVRFYERIGLIDRPPKPRGGGYRVYPDSTVERIRFIRRAANGLGFTLREVSELLDLRDKSDADAADIRAAAESRLRDTMEKIRQLREIEQSLRTLLDRCPGRGAVTGCSIISSLESSSD